MTILKAFRDLIAADAGVGVKTGESLFIEGWPAANRSGVMLRHYFGGVEFDHELPRYRKASFQVIVRDPSYAAGEARAWKIIETLTIEQERDIPGMQVKFCRPRAEPFPFPESPSKLNEFLVNFDCAVVLDP